MEPVRTGFIVENVFSGLKVVSGKCSVQSIDWTAGKANFLVESPCMLKVEWGTDYTKLIAILAALLGVAIVSLYARTRVHTLKQRTQLRAERERAEAAVATQLVETKAVSATAPGELAGLMEEASKLRNYLGKLEEARTEGRISYKVYEELKNEYSSKLEEVEKKIAELQKKKLESSS